ncbi:hypothetical protein T472_0207135 [Youngiibacter fragilis 232.1]|uniref:Uncharacterized protein n=1 Tax=Youngiibacter fragilis 232.1 TaxID=994573 RepID=V7I5W7_9CLOT|nr:hypothetical protein T472_0207135 [Youngiibacter fragilis 232.1]
MSTEGESQMAKLSGKRTEDDGTKAASACLSLPSAYRRPNRGLGLFFIQMKRGGRK